jgi:hypothetical protein
MHSFAVGSSVLTASGESVFSADLGRDLAAPFKKLLAHAQAVAQGPSNTRAVPLVRKDDAHQGRVSFLPRSMGEFGGNLA